ncbi:MAG: TetR/AcrR family transcriptional regulator [Acidimicrobiales bacterium]|jgi:AcrR family transcriptional regulator
MSDVQGTRALKPTTTTSSGAVPPPVRARRPGRQAVRRRLLDAALKVFAESGFANATLDQVAAAAGLTKGAVYSNFESKDDLFFAMMADQFLNRLETVRSALAAHPGGTSRERVSRDIGRLLTAAFVEHRQWQLVFLDFWGRAVRDDDVRAQYLAHRRTLRAAIAERVEQVLGTAPDLGDLSVDDVVTVVLALSNGLAIEQYVSPELVSDGLFGRVLERLSRRA